MKLNNLILQQDDIHLIGRLFIITHPIAVVYCGNIHKSISMNIFNALT
jgi:hypothetical protein